MDGCKLEEKVVCLYSSRIYITYSESCLFSAEESLQFHTSSGPDTTNRSTLAKISAQDGRMTIYQYNKVYLPTFSTISFKTPADNRMYVGSERDIFLFVWVKHVKELCKKRIGRISIELAWKSLSFWALKNFTIRNWGFKQLSDDKPSSLRHLESLQKYSTNHHQILMILSNTTKVFWRCHLSAIRSKISVLVFEHLTFWV